MPTSLDFSIQQQRLAQLIYRRTQGNSHYEMPDLGLKLFRLNHPTEPVGYVQNASLCLIAQGKKQVILENESYVYDPKHFLITAIDLPILANIINASPEQPYLGLTLSLDLSILTQILLEHPFIQQIESTEKIGIAIGQTNASLLDATSRLIHLLDSPQDIAVLAPLVQKEIYYRLLLTSQGQRLRQFISQGTQGHRILKSIEWLRQNFTQPIQIQTLAESISMSISSFHQHFKDITTMSPLQYQKKLRLNEARRLIITENMDISSAAINVGYESPSQFSREYHRYFGVAPSSDSRLHKAAQSSQAS